MSIITLQEIKVLKNPTKFTDKFEFEITFNAVEKLDGDIEWKLIYVGSPDSSDYDQVLDTVLVGPVPKGKNKFSFSAPGPDPKKIPKEHLLGVTACMVCAFYKEKEFLRVGYFVRNDIIGQDTYKEIKNEESGEVEVKTIEVPDNLDYNTVERTIMADKPRITTFPIEWK